MPFTSEPLDLSDLDSLHPLSEPNNLQTSRNSNVLQKMVSQNRNRFISGNFDLDLSYITERMIAMGLPGESYRSIYRNSK